MGLLKSLFQTNANLDTAGIYTETIIFRVPLEVLQAMPAVCQSLGWALGLRMGETRWNKVSAGPSSKDPSSKLPPLTKRRRLALTFPPGCQNAITLAGSGVFAVAYG